MDLFECVESFIKRLKVYTEIPCTPAMEDVVAKIMVELFSVLPWRRNRLSKAGSVSVRLGSTLGADIHGSTSYNAEKFAKRLLGESEIEAVLQRLDRLTKEEARTTVI